MINHSHSYTPFLYSSWNSLHVLPVCCLKKRIRWDGSAKLKAQAISLIDLLVNKSSFLISANSLCFSRQVADTPYCAITLWFKVMRLILSSEAQSCTRSLSSAANQLCGISNTKHFALHGGSISKINIPIIQSLSLRHERENSE